MPAGPVIQKVRSEIHTKRSYQKVIPKSHTKRSYQKVIPKGHTKRSYQRSYQRSRARQSPFDDENPGSGGHALAADPGYLFLYCVRPAYILRAAGSDLIQRLQDLIIISVIFRQLTDIFSVLME